MTPTGSVHTAHAETLFTVTQLAAELGITARTLRFYEDRGLIAPPPPRHHPRLRTA